MLSDIFYWIFNMSIIASLCGLVILILRKIKRFPKFAVYILWLIPFIRFIIPFGFQNIYNPLGLLSKYSIKTQVVWEKVPLFSMTNCISEAESYFPVEYKTDVLAGIFNVSSIIWAAVAAAAILSAILLYFVSKSGAKNAKHLYDNIYVSADAASPAVYGIIRPKIIIPSVLAEGDIEYTVLHEKVHIRRRDNLWRLLAILTACIHWFNPMAWIFVKAFFADMEFACDNKVLKNIDDPREYAKAVLDASQGKAFFRSAFGGAKTKNRIENILSYKKLTLFSAICTGIFIVAVAVTLITNSV